MDFRKTFPELSEQEQDRIVNYASGLLIRYMKNSPDKLTYLEPTYTPSYLAEADTIVPPAPETQPEQQHISPGTSAADGLPSAMPRLPRCTV